MILAGHCLWSWQGANVVMAELLWQPSSKSTQGIMWRLIQPLFMRLWRTFWLPTNQWLIPLPHLLTHSSSKHIKCTEWLSSLRLHLINSKYNVPSTNIHRPTRRGAGSVCHTSLSSVSTIMVQCYWPDSELQLFIYKSDWFQWLWQEYRSKSNKKEDIDHQPDLMVSGKKLILIIPTPTPVATPTIRGIAIIPKKYSILRM